MTSPEPVWPIRRLILRTAVLGGLVFLIGTLALVPMLNVVLRSVRGVAIAVNLVVFCGTSMVVPLYLLRRFGEQTQSPGRRATLVLSFAAGWLATPTALAAIFLPFARRLPQAAWALTAFEAVRPLLVSMLVAFTLAAVIVAVTGPRAAGPPS